MIEDNKARLHQENLTLLQVSQTDQSLEVENTGKATFAFLRVCLTDKSETCKFTIMIFAQKLCNFTFTLAVIRIMWSDEQNTIFLLAILSP